MIQFFSALVSAILQHVTSLIKEDKKGIDGDKAPKELREAFTDTIRRKYRDGMRDD